MGNNCSFDIHEEHAELLHSAADIQFQIAYKNGLLDATIIYIDKNNVQAALESYFSQAGIPKKNIIPTGSRNGVNLVYTIVEEFIPGSLEVFLDGIKLRGNQTDAERDYDEAVDYKGFTILLDPTNSNRMKVAPCESESLEVHYLKRITFNTKGGT